MSKYAGRDYKKFALIAGFNEIGETIEETVHREVMEEVGLKVKNLTYYKSQPWSFSELCSWDSSANWTGRTRRSLWRRTSCRRAGWYLPEEVPEDEEEIALTREMMTVFKEGKGLFENLINLKYGPGADFNRGFPGPCSAYFSRLSFSK